jgi:hypothetical protein
MDAWTARPASSSRLSACALHMPLHPTSSNHDIPLDGIRVIDDHDPRFVDPVDVLLLVLAPVSAMVLLGIRTSANLQAAVARLTDAPPWCPFILHLLQSCRAVDVQRHSRKEDQRIRPVPRTRRSSPVSVASSFRLLTVQAGFLVFAIVFRGSCKLGSGMRKGVLAKTVSSAEL